MSDSTTCPSCDASVPAGAIFCTNCGARVGGTAAAAGDAAPTPSDHRSGSGAGDDATRVDTPGLHDATEVFHPPASPAAPPPAPAPAPWQPAEASAAAAPSVAAPWDPPAAPSPPPWQQPPPPAGGPGGWGHPAPQAPPGSGQWGASAPGPAPAPASDAKKPSPLAGIIAVVGTVLVLVGLFLPWIGNNQDDGRYEASGWDLTSGGQALESIDPYLVLALGLVGLLLAALLFVGLARPIVRIGVVVVGLAVVAILARDWMTITDLVADDPAVDSSFEVSAQIGFYLTIAGGVVLALAALAPASGRPSSART